VSTATLLLTLCFLYACISAHPLMENRLFRKCDTAKAIIHYIKALIALCPWSSDPSIMSYTFAKQTGLASMYVMLFV
jgi:hypothetical protein